MREKTYLQLMGEYPVHIVLTLDTQQPMELGAFVGQFTSLGNEFERYIKERHPDLKEEARFFVKEVRAGSTIVEMIPELVWAAPFLANAEHLMIAEDFIRRWGSRLTTFIEGRTTETPDTKSELKDWADAVKLIATDPNATHRLEAATFEDGKREIRAAFRFDTKQARQAQIAIEARRRELDHKTHADHERVLMVFTRTDINNVDVGKRSGELVKIEAINEKALALMYASELAESQIKHEVREADDNVYKKGFVVDVNVQMKSGKPVAYAVTQVHQVIDLQED